MKPHAQAWGFRFAGYPLQCFAPVVSADFAVEEGFFNYPLKMLQNGPIKVKNAAVYLPVQNHDYQSNN